MDSDRIVHPDCINASNPYHGCVKYCFKKIVEARGRLEKQETVHEQTRESLDDKSTEESSSGEEMDEEYNGNPYVMRGLCVMRGNRHAVRKKKLFELRRMRLEAKKANRLAVETEKKKMEAQTETKGISRQKRLEKRKKKIGKLLAANGLDMTKAYMLDTQEVAEAKYKKWGKEPISAGWDVFDQKTLYNAYKKRTKSIQVDLEDYNKMRAADPEASSLLYGKAPKTSQDKIDKMAKELHDREQQQQDLSRRRKFKEEKDIDSINNRNEHFNKKIKCASGKYSL